MFRIAAILSALLFLAACSPLERDARHHHADVMQIQSNLADAIFNLNRYLEHADTAELREAYRQTLAYTQEIKQHLFAEDGFKPDTSLQMACIRLVESYHMALCEEVAEMMAIVTKPDELDDADEARLTRLRRKLMERLSRAERSFAKAENRFRRQYLHDAFAPAPDTTLFADSAGSAPLP